MPLTNDAASANSVRPGVRVAAGLLVVVMLCAIGELAARWASPFLLQDGEPYFIIEESFMHEPAVVREVRGVPLWFREFEGRAEPKPVKEEFRILILGDSILEPAALEQHEGAAAKLVPALARLANGREFEVINTSQGGWGTVQEEAWFFEVGIDMDPDLVLISITDNDKQQFVHHRGQIMHVKLVDSLRERETHGLIGTAARRSYLYNLLWLVVARASIDKELEPEKMAEHRLVLEPLRRIHAATRERGMRLALICFGQRSESRSKQRETVCGLPGAVAWARSADVPLFFASSLFDDLPPDDVWMDHIHLSPLGHDILTRSLAPWLLEAGLLDDAG